MGRRREQTPPLALQTPEFQGAWGRWVSHITERCGKMTTGQREIHMKKCVAMGSEAAVKAIEWSIENGYRSIFEPPEKRKQSDNGLCGPGERPRALTRDELANWRPE